MAWWASYKSLFLTLSFLSFLLALGDRLWLDLTSGDVIIKRSSRNAVPAIEWSGVSITNWIWLVTSRTMIVSLNISFLTVLWVIPNVLEEAVPWWVEMNVRYSNYQIHRFTGLWLNAIPAVVHVAVLLLPTVTDGIPMDLEFDGLDFSEWWDPIVKTFSSYVTKEGVLYTWDEVLRLVLILLIFCCLLPLSRSTWMLSRSYSLAMGIHALVGFLFMVDMVRKTSHPLCWRFNLPFIFLYILDRIYATLFYRVNKFVVHEIRECSDSVFVLFGRIEGLAFGCQACGDNFWLLHKFSGRHPCTPLFQRAHPYTAFQNRDKRTQNSWNVGFVINVNKANKHSWSLWLMERNKFLNAKEIKVAAPYIKNAWNSQQGVQNLGFETQDFGEFNPTTGNQCPFDSRGNKVASRAKEGEDRDDGQASGLDSTVAIVEHVMEFEIRSWGPYRSAFYVIKDFSSYKNLVLIAGGSGFGLIMSAASILCEYDQRNEEASESKLRSTTVVFSARNRELIREGCNLLTTIPNFELMKVAIHSTGGSEDTEGRDDTVKESEFGFEVHNDRVNLDKVFKSVEKEEGDTLVCACASSGFLKEVKKSAKQFKFRLRVEEI